MPSPGLAQRVRSELERKGGEKEGREGRSGEGWKRWREKKEVDE